jgi:hypothetical protein
MSPPGHIGASGSGKSTIARRLANKHGLRLYLTDEAMGDHASRWRQEDCPNLTEFVKMSMDQSWVDRSPQTMLETFHWFRGEGFGLIIEDLLALPPDQGVIVEGFRLLPYLVKPLLPNPSRGVWLVPTPEFRLAALESRGTMWIIPNKTSNPKRALSNLLERDRLFTERLQDTLETTSLPAIKVDDRLTEDALERIPTSLRSPRSDATQSLPKLRHCFAWTVRTLLAMLLISGFLSGNLLQGISQRCGVPKKGPFLPIAAV